MRSPGKQSSFGNAREVLYLVTLVYMKVDQTIGRNMEDSQLQICTRIKSIFTIC